jgi:hypothetical protein
LQPSSASAVNAYTYRGHAFSRSYGVNLQSSLGWVLSSALGFSPHPPVSVYGTGYTFATHADFLGSMGSLTCPKTQLGNCLSLKGAPLVSYAPSLTTTTQTDNGLSYPSPSLLATIAQYRYRNINLFAIAYAFRPRLRTRLTPGGLTWPGNPWVYGERVSHSFFRYSLWHNLLSPLQSFFRSAFTAKTMLPYHSYVPWIV